MHRLTDNELIDELKSRLDENRRMLEETKRLNEELQAVNQKLMDSEALKSHFLSNIRNEINNPLTAILGLSENLAAENNLDSAGIKKMLTMIYQEVFNLDFQLRTIFAAAEFEAGEARLHPARVNIDLLIRRVIKSFEHMLDKKQLQIEYESNLEECGEPHFNTDSEKLHLILSNLISNAVEYSNEKNRVIITAQKEPDRLIITVQDFGQGIGKKDIQRIFDRFCQLDSGLTKMHKGQGLGLSVVRDALEMLQGKINVSSEKNKGSLFTIALEQLSSAEDIDIFAMDGNEEMF